MVEGADRTDLAGDRRRTARAPLLIHAKRSDVIHQDDPVHILQRLDPLCMQKSKKLLDIAPIGIQGMRRTTVALMDVLQEARQIVFHHSCFPSASITPRACVQIASLR